MNIDKNWWERQLQWQTSVIQAYGTGKKSRLSRWLFFLVLLTTVGFVIYQSHEELLAHYYAGEYEEMHELLIVLFPVIFLVTQIKKTLKRSKFGDTPFLMNPFPAILGEKFAGTVEINKKIDGLTFKAELLLLRYVEEGLVEEDGVHTAKELAWRMPLELQQERSMLGGRLLIRGVVPSDKPPSQAPSGGPYHAWELYVYSQDKSFKRRWPVPIIAANDYL